MTSMGQLKNSLELLKKYAAKTYLLERFTLRPRDLEERELRANNPIIFLKIANYLLLEFNPSLYQAVLNIAPEVKLQSDRKFLETCYTVVRNILDGTPIITVDQFLTNRFFEQKVQFVAELARAVYQWEITNRNKAPTYSITKAGTSSSGTVNSGGQVVSKQEPNHYSQIVDKYSKGLAGQGVKQQTVQRKGLIGESESDQEEDERPKQLRVMPTHKTTAPVRQTQEPEPLIYSKKTQNGYKEQPEEQQQANQQDQEFTVQEPISKLQIYTKQERMPEIPITSHASQQYVTQSQLAETYELITKVSGTVNELVHKLNSFQANVLGWVNNINEKMVILEHKINIIRANQH